VLAVIATGVAVVACATLLVGVRGDASSLYIGGRLSEPTGYANTTAALFLIGFWPAVHVSLQRGFAWPARAFALGAACLVLQVAILTQSRGGAIALALTVVAFVALTPQRFGALGALAVLGGLSAINWETLTAIRVAGSSESLATAHEAATTQIALGSVGAAAIGAIAALTVRRLWSGAEAPQALMRVCNLALAVLAAGAVLLTGALAASNRDWIDARWQDFKSGAYEQVDAGTTRFGASLASGRYDYYRVSLIEFREHPLLGIGADNFSVPYLEQRRTSEAPSDPHGLALRILSQLGLVGSMLFAVLLAAVARSFIALRRRRNRDDNAAAAAALAGALLWFVHALGDWLWAVPTVSMLGFVLLAVTANPMTSPESTDRRPENVNGARLRRGTRVVVVIAGAVAALSLIPPWLSAKYEQSGREALSSDPVAAYATLGRAADLNPLSADSLLARGLIARELDRIALARTALTEAVSREPDNWFASFELGLLDAEGGRRSSALRHLSTAQRLNPRQPVIAGVRREVRRGRRIDAVEAERQLYDEIEISVAPTG